ncbi:MAG: TonB-dependent receptor [Gemmatimonadota bacterium]
MTDSNRGPTGSTLLLFLTLLLPAGAATQQEVRDTFHLPEVVVTANRMATPQARIPQSVTTLHGDDLRARGVHFLMDALREVPGVQVVRTGSLGASTSVFLRGGNSNFVKVLLDGAPLNEPGGRFDFGSLTLENVERIEVVRGPSSVLYGSDAVAGVIQIFTRQGRSAPSISASLQSGTLGAFSGEAATRGAWERVDYSLSLGRTETGGIYPVNSEFAALVASGRVAVRPDDRSRLTLALRIQDSQYRFPTNSSGEVTDSNQFTFDDGVTISLEGTRLLTEALEGQLHLRVAQGERGFQNDPDSPADSMGFGFAGRRLSTTVRRGMDARLVWRGERGSVVGGSDWEVEQERRLARTASNFGEGVDISADSFEGDRWNGALYLQGTLDGPAGSIWNAGFRTDRNEVFGSFLTTQAGVVLPLGQNRRIRASVGSAFKAPTFSHQFANSPFEVGNPDLKPEESVAWEVGADAGFLDNRVVVGSSWFRQDFTNLIQYAFVGADLPSYFNEERARAAGVESSLTFRGPGGSELGVDHSWLDTRLVVDELQGEQAGEAANAASDRRLLRRPTHQVGVRARTPLPGKASLGLSATRVGDRADMDFRSWPAERVVLDAYTLLDVDLQLPLPSPWDSSSREQTPLLLTLRGENLADTEFESVVGFPGVGRRFLVGLRWNP